LTRRHLELQLQCLQVCPHSVPPHALAGPRSCDPLELVRLPFGGSDPLYFVLVNPLFEAPTKQMRAVLPRDVPFKSMIHNSTQGGALVAAILQGEGRALASGRAVGRLIAVAVASAGASCHGESGLTSMQCVIFGVFMCMPVAQPRR
jgi:hypothetical protein